MMRIQMPQLLKSMAATTFFAAGSLLAQEAPAPPMGLQLSNGPFNQTGYYQAEAGAACATCASDTACEACASCEDECEEEESPFSFTGWLDAGITWNGRNPVDRFNGPTTFNDRDGELMMNQFYLIAQRTIEADGCNWDFGFRIDAVFGTDSRFTKATGLEWDRGFNEKWNSNNRRFYQFALPQFYVEAALPIGNGLTVKAGHFYTLIGYEVVTAPDGFFYSHAYTHQYGEPFTHTGVLLSYPWGENLSVTAGVTRGWDNFDDNNSSLAFLGSATLTFNEEKTSLTYALHTGPEQNLNNANNRFMQSIVLNHQISDSLTYIFESDLGIDENLVAPGVDAQWYGINQYLLYTMSEEWAFGVRAEWFRDDAGVRVVSLNNTAGQPVGTHYATLPGIPGGVGTHFFEVTVGANWSPAENLKIRPEVRFDWSNASGGSVNPYNFGANGSQVLAGFDVIYSF